MAWGIETCPKNSEVMVAIDMPAGPSEVLVIADKHAIPCHVAADLLSQSDSQVVLVIAGKGVNVNAIEEELKNQCQSLPRGVFSAEAHSFIVYARDVLESINFSNLYAPEHLIVNVNVEDAEKWEGFIENAVMTFSVGDYASRKNHELPTYGYARMYGGVSLYSFLKYIMKSYRLLELTDSELQSLKARPRVDFSSVFAVDNVNPIVDDVRTRGDAAVKEYIWKFEKAKLDKAVAIVSELPDPVLDGALKEAFDVAYSRIYAFHAAQKTSERIVENMKVLYCAKKAGVTRILKAGGAQVRSMKLEELVK
ncbi:hypothetical protein PIB30_009153 [Stylosanthes scabra]|uniref:Uncharacterized protein n=1 Tax=Stylosanthes scabra TaxID=79078 RepID=A0ABU6X486_9FABA|nr:hypothetical protein [Stylosanthes scabra]